MITITQQLPPIYIGARERDWTPVGKRKTHKEAIQLLMQLRKYAAIGTKFRCAGMEIEVTSAPGEER